VRNIAIKQALFFPFGAMLALMLVGFTVPGYSSTSQQLSELGLLGGYPAAFEMISAIIVGVSIIIFSAALVRHQSGRFAFTVFTSSLFGISMLCNGIFHMGSPLHGLYGIGFFAILTPALFVAELHPNEQTKGVSVISMLAAVITLFYLWLTITGFDPKGLHGLTQRLAVVPMIGWYSYASYTLLRSRKVA
jgi:hypothetical membrane protein